MEKNVIDLARDNRFNDFKRMEIANSECIYKILSDILIRYGAYTGVRYVERENFYILGLESDHFLSFIERIIYDQYIEKKLKPLDIFHNAIIRRVQYVIIAHNVPYDEKKKSNLRVAKKDIDIADQLYQFAKHADLPVLNYVIMNENAYIDDKKTRILDKAQKSLKYALTEEMKNSIDERIAELQKRFYNDGLQDGIIKGENNKALNIAKSMKNDGCDIDMIVKYSGLTRKEIEKL